MQSVNELEENLLTYRGQLEQVNQLLELEPENEEYTEMAAGLVEVIELTQDLLTSAQQQQHQDAADTGTDYASHSSLSNVPGAGGVPGDAVATAAAEAAALATAFRLDAGTSVQAVWSGDNQWREGVIDSVTRGGYMVRFGEGVGNGTQMHEVREMRVKRTGEDDEEVRQRAREALAVVEKEAEATKVALKRRMTEAAQKEIEPAQIPAKLRIKPDDSEEVKAEKKRKIHAIKSRKRLHDLEVVQSKKQNAWMQFQSKGRQKKAGFFTGKKRDSIFKSPEDPTGKVGVIGSGQGMTDFQRREKHSGLKLSIEEEEDGQE